MDKDIRNLMQESIEIFFEKKSAIKHPLNYIFPEQRYIRSVIGGLETSMEQSFWEKLAKMLATKNNFKIKDERSFNQSVPDLSDKIMTLITQPYLPIMFRTIKV